MRRAAGLGLAGLIAATAALPLAAQPEPVEPALPFDATVTEACLAGRTDPVGRSACIGVAAAHCLTASGEINEPEVYVRCYEAETADWQGRLADVMARLASTGATSDAAEAAGPGSGRRAALEVAQAAWAAWRDAECAFALRMAEGGGSEAVTSASCAMRLTAERALMLDHVSIQQVGP